MIKKIMAVIAAAGCAGVIVTLTPELAPETAARASSPADRSVSLVANVNTPMEATAPNAADIGKAVEPNIHNGSGIDTSTCVQTWPYYGRSCLLGGNQAAGNVRFVRVIAMDGPTVPPTREARGKSQPRTR
jgi:hypothetical protein